MKTKMIWANLVSSDIQKTIQFYTSLGFKQNGAETKELVSFVFGENDEIATGGTPGTCRGWVTLVATGLGTF